MGSSRSLKTFFEGSAAETWSKDMASRGYRMGSVTPRGSNMVNLGRDQAEEAAIRASAGDALKQ